MKRLCLAVLVFFCLAGVVWAAVPNPQPPILTGGSWTGTIRVTDLTTGTSSIVPLTIVVTAQVGGGVLHCSVNLGTLTFPGVHGTIDGSYIYINGSNATSSIYLQGTLGWYPYPRITVTYISSGNKAYGDSILTPTP